jgi:signal transduction histidine kinase
VQNALDATNDDGKVSVRIHESRPGRLTVVVEDSGRGMSPEFLRERLSRPFQTTKASGMGLGVFEARQYLTELGGDIRYESAIGVGTTVTIELPAIRRGTALPEQGVTSEHG